MLTGTDLGSYRVLEKLGEGGMGEVYRARDAKLDRDVAVKILPEFFASDPDRLMRFDREAKTLAALNHPNIAQIYGLEDSGRVRALVMELVPGDDLSQVIQRGPAPLEHAVSIARQIADALEAAHEAGIVHRDLKPANVKVREDGTIKVLDFGLAKAFGPADVSSGAAAPGVSQAHSPTFTSPALTQMGTILGTAAYMSPEQAKGKAVDKRADIWAFGIILIEMLTGRPLFAYESIAETLGAVVRAEVDWSRLPSDTPPRLRALLERCLQPDPRLRLRDIGDARFELQHYADPPPGSAATPAKPASGRSRLLWISAAAVALAAIPAATWLSTGSPPPAPVLKVSIPLPDGMEFSQAASVPTSIAVAPDGGTIAFAAIAAEGAEPTLYLRRLDADESVEVPDSRGVRSAFFSPDSRWVAFVAGGTLRKVPLSGGAAVVVAGGIRNFWGGTWLSDGSIIYSDPQPTGEMLYRVAAAGGTPSLISRVERLDMDHSFPTLLGADELIISRWTGGLYASGQIARYSLRTNTVSELLIDGGSNGRLVSDHLVYARGGELLAAGFDTASRTVIGTPFRVLDGMFAERQYASPHFDVSPSGVLAYAPRSAAAAPSQLVLLGRDGSTEPLVSDPYLDEASVRISAESRYVVHRGLSPEGDLELWTYDRTARRRGRLTSIKGEEYNPVFSRDGRSVIFAAWRGAWGMHQAPLLGGSETPVVFADGTPSLRPWSFSPDGRWLLVTHDMEGGGDLGVADMSVQPHVVRWLPVAKSTEWSPRVAPDGRHVAYESDQGGQRQVWIVPFSAGEFGTAAPVSREGGTRPFWSADGAILYFSSGPSLLAIDAGNNRPLDQVAEPRLVGTFKDAHIVDVAVDGRFVAVRHQHAPITRINLVVNFHRLLNDITAARK